MTSARILDGNLAASQIKQELAVRVSRLTKKPGLATILVGDDPGSISYVAGKHRDCAEIGIESIRVELPANTSTETIISRIEDLNSDNACTGMIVQLPLPRQVDAFRVLSTVHPTKDADGLHPTNLGKLVLNHPTIYPCTPHAIIELARLNQISWEGKEVVVIGRGTTVGRPLGLMLSQRDQNATVTLTHTGTRDLISHTRRADIVIAAIGQAHFLKPEMIKAGAIIFDVGITRTAEGLQGDVDPRVVDVASAFSPMPGGVGPMTRAMLLANIVTLAEQF
jgi:methylenetetrahydrofolate dehydrogenase (NADP+) / methenyltetrahydrofolate cyclohydrolase